MASSAETIIPSNLKPFLKCLGIQLRVLHALMMRELITRYGRDNLGVLWLVGEPMIFTLGVTTLWHPNRCFRGYGLFICLNVA
jgi:capsular polysaccharide transport system permease protein